MRAAVAILLVVIGAALVVIGVPSALTAWHAAGAVVSSCDESLLATRSGTWVRLHDCGVDMFHAGFLERDGQRTHRLVPLREPWGSAEEASGIALAVPTGAIDATVFGTTPRPDVERSKVADLADSRGVVLGRLRPGADRVVKIEGFDTALNGDALLIEIRQPPSLSRSGAIVAGGVAIALMAIPFFFVPARERSLDRPVRVPALANVRWGLVFTLVLVGTVAFFSSLGWYFDPIRQTAPLSPAASTTARPRAATTPGKPARPALPNPTEAELALIASPYPDNQVKGADMLLARAVTPDVVRAVDAALQRPLDPRVEERLVCLKARFDTPDTLDFLLARFPRDRRAIDWNLKPDVACVLDALAARAPEAPERVCAALIPAVYASNATTRDKALKAFRRVDLPQVPVTLIAEASWPQAPNRRFALQAALALGAVRHNPDLVAAAAKDPGTAPLLRTELIAEPHPNAARIVASTWSQQSDGTIERTARDREGQQHDVSAALLEIVMDETRPDWTRAMAARRLATLAEVGPLRDLRELAPVLPAGDLTDAVQAAISALSERQQRGVRAQMHALPPK